VLYIVTIAVEAMTTRYVFQFTLACYFSSHLNAISVECYFSCMLFQFTIAVEAMTTRYVFQFTLACYFSSHLQGMFFSSHLHVFQLSDSGKTEIDSPIPDCTYEASPKLELEGFN